MNGWTKKRKVDTFMGILLQVYCFFPWMRINRKWNTIHMYVIKTFQENDYIKMYNHTFLKQHMWKWKHSQVVAFIFLLMLIFLILLQSIELYKLYQCIKNGNQSTNYHVFVWITYLEAEMEEAENQSEYWMEEEHLDMEKSNSYEAEADRMYQEVYKMHNQVADFIVSLTSGQIDKVTAMLMMRQRRSDVERILEMA